MFDKTLPAPARDLLLDLNSGLEQFGFYLAGGSGLALQLGHRVSEDLDFFSSQKFVPGVISHYLEAKGQYQEIMVSPGTLHCRLHDVKLSFIHYSVPLCYTPVRFNSVKVADWKDIIADKFKTLSQRGSRKDFYDLYVGFTIGNLKIAEGVKLLRQRFAGTGLNYYHVLKSLVYFEDADNEPELRLLKPISWREVKEFFVRNLKEFEKYLLD